MRSSHANVEPGASASSLVVLVAVLLLAAAVGYYLYSSGALSLGNNFSPATTTAPKTIQGRNDSIEVSPAVKELKSKFTAEIRVDSLLGSNPPHGVIYSFVPKTVSISLNKAIADGSRFTVSKDGKEYSASSVAIDYANNKMSRTFYSAAPDGIYTVSYRACTASGCQDGNYQFAISRK